MKSLLQAANAQFEQDMGKQEMLLYCRLPTAEGDRDCRQLFTHVNTQLGICSALNAVKFEDTYLESQYSRLCFKSEKIISNVSKIVTLSPRWRSVCKNAAAL